MPNVILRDVTDRAETIEVGSNIPTGAGPDMILLAVRIPLEATRAWNLPAEYVNPMFRLLGPGACWGITTSSERDKHESNQTCT